VRLRPAGPAGVYTDGSWFYTRNLDPGIAVYGEGLLEDDGVEYRRWDANRSKLAAYLKKGGRAWPFSPSTNQLYLGAGSGTTVSHLSDLSPSGSIVAVELSPRAFRDLVRLAERRRNVLPILGDASRPETYRGHIATVDVLYQDVAQRDQERIFARNLEFLRPGGMGFLMIKARSVDVAAEPSDVYESARRTLASTGLEILDLRPLDPFEADHASLVVRKR
jgi:fibrillarin-like pre-rRNA processing protein